MVYSEDSAFLAGRRADIIKPLQGFRGGRGSAPTMDGKHIGVFGELHPEVILNFALSYPMVGFEVEI